MDESLFSKVPVKVQNKSGFDLSFQNLFTTQVGTITPVLCEELIPNETVHLSAAIQAQLPPLASDTFMRCNLKYEAFFVPTRLLFPGFEGWLVPGSTTQSRYPADSAYQPVWPLLSLRSEDVQRGSLADFLGFKSNIPSGYTTEMNKNVVVNALPFLGYHKIYDDWYRNSLVQSPVYINGNYVSGTYSAAYALVTTPCKQKGYQFITVTSSTQTSSGRCFNDGVDICSLRQRNFGIDYFTSATPQAQNGSEQGLSWTINSGTTGLGFTIGQLRAANSIQQWLERNNLAGNRLTDYVRANYGANLSYGIAQKAVLLGSGTFPVYSKGIYQQNTDATSGLTNNPFSTTAAKYGSAFASGKETIIDSFTAQEPGYLYVMVTLVPKVTYANGIDKKLLRYTGNSRTDMANPMLQNTGNEPIIQSELISDFAFTQTGWTKQVFGYVDRYASWKSKQDELHGELRENSEIQWTQGVGEDTGGTLGSFALQSAFDNESGILGISTDFLQIPKTYLDKVAAAKDGVSKYGLWCDTYFDFKVSMPLARYAMPSLQDPAYEHGDTIVLDRGGKRL